MSRSYFDIVFVVLFAISSGTCLGRVLITDDSLNTLKKGQIFYIQVVENISCCRKSTLVETDAPSCIRFCGCERPMKFLVPARGASSNFWYKFEACAVGQETIYVEHTQFGRSMGRDTYDVAVVD